MPNCRNCSAPLPAGTIVCSYCSTRVDIDLSGLHEHTVTAPRTDRTCPRCSKNLLTVDIRLGGTFLIERCEKCLGLFFDPGELEKLLDSSVAPAFEVDYRMLDALANSPRHEERTVAYVKCPVCGLLMNRVQFGARSGVVADRCRDHGVWLDGGELRQLMEWARSGGKLLDQRREEQRKAQEERTKRRRDQERRSRLPPAETPLFSVTTDPSLETSALTLLAKVAIKLLR
jgi:Zn-finger nucleic acid-binding protein